MKAPHTSKLLLILVIGAGITGLAINLDPSPTQLAAYSLILAGAVYNRLDSRKQGYKLSLSLGAAGLSLETNGDKHDFSR